MYNDETYTRGLSRDMIGLIVFASMTGLFYFVVVMIPLIVSLYNNVMRRITDTDTELEAGPEDTEQVVYQASLETEESSIFTITDHPNCPICLSDIKTDESGYVLACEHVFHVKCISKWFNHFNPEKQCPMCRAVVRFPYDPPLGPAQPQTVSVTFDISRYP